MMNRRTAFLTIVLALLSAPVSAQTSQQSAADYFHDGAKSFIGEDLTQAAATVRDGLANYPSDADLVELDALIREAMEQQQQNQGQNEQEQSENEESEDADGEDQQQQGEQQEGEESDPSDDEQQQDQPGEPQNQEEEQSEDDSVQPPSEVPVDSDQLTPEEAERILQALANEEEQLLREVQKVKGRPRRVEKDW